MAINQHKDAYEQQEQRLREIEAIVDGLDDVSSIPFLEGGHIPSLPLVVCGLSLLLHTLSFL